MQQNCRFSRSHFSAEKNRVIKAFTGGRTHDFAGAVGGVNLGTVKLGADSETTAVLKNRPIHSNRCDGDWW